MDQRQEQEHYKKEQHVYPMKIADRAFGVIMSTMKK